MSLRIIEEAIREFISTESAEVLSIKGGWGVGKTFFWNKLIKEKRNETWIQLLSATLLVGKRGQAVVVSQALRPASQRSLDEEIRTAYP